MAKPPAEPKPKDKKAGLSLGATVGIAIAVALLVISGALAAWIVIRRRRRRWAAQRKDVSDPENDGNTPNEEISRKVEAEKSKDLAFAHDAGLKAVEAPGDEASRVELAGDEGKGYPEKRPMSELYAENNAHEMPAMAQSPIEIGDGRVFIAELDGGSIPTKEVDTLPQARDEKETSKPAESNKFEGDAN